MIASMPSWAQRGRGTAERRHTNSAAVSKAGLGSRPAGRTSRHWDIEPTEAKGTAFVVVASIAVGLVVAGLLTRWGPEVIDLKVYRLGATALLTTARNLCAAREPATGLAFTYPVLAAVSFIPYELMPWAMARATSVTLSIATLWLLCQVTVA